MLRIKMTFGTLAIAIVASLLCIHSADGKKPPKPPGDGPSYRLTDLLGFPGELGYQSQGMFVTNQDEDGNVLIYGHSHYLYAEAPAELYPALWRVAADGTFPATDPLDLGVPSWAIEVEPWGFNSDGVGVGVTRRSVDRFPSYVDIPGIGYQEVPAPVDNDSFVQAINDLWQIVGGYLAIDPQDPAATVWVGGLWQVNPLDGSISNPTNLGDFYPVDINHYGVMTGRFGGVPAIAWFDGPDLEIRTLNSPAFEGADPRALNDRDIDDPLLTVVGDTYVDGASHGFAWKPYAANNSTTVLGTLGGSESSARDVNSAGDIVGWADTRRKGQQAFIYSGGKMSNLNSMVDTGGATLQWARAINDDGDIVGFMRYPRPISESHGYLLRQLK